MPANRGMVFQQSNTTAQERARAVKAAIERHTVESTFEQLIGEADALRARRMGITLD